MGVPTSEVGYTSAMPRREDHEVRKGHVGHWGKKILPIYVAWLWLLYVAETCSSYLQMSQWSCALTGYVFFYRVFSKHNGDTTPQNYRRLPDAAKLLLIPWKKIKTFSHISSYLIENSRLIPFAEITDIQGECKVFPWLQTFITRKLRGIQTCFFLSLLELVSKVLCHVFIVTFGFWMQHFQTGGLGETVRHTGHHDRRISPPLTSFYGGMLRTKCFRHQFQILQIWRQE